MEVPWTREDGVLQMVPRRRQCLTWPVKNKGTFVTLAIRKWRKCMCNVSRGQPPVLRRDRQSMEGEGRKCDTRQHYLSALCTHCSQCPTTIILCSLQQPWIALSFSGSDIEKWFVQVIPLWRASRREFVPFNIAPQFHLLETNDTHNQIPSQDKQ